MKKMFVLFFLISIAISNTGCTLQKLIDNTVSALMPVQVVRGTVTLPAQSNHSGTSVLFKGKQTTTDSNGSFRLTVSSTSTQEIKTMGTDQMTISHSGYNVENIDVPAETESGEYAVSKILNLTLLPVTLIYGTLTLPNQNNHSGTIISFNGNTTTTDINGNFQLKITYTFDPGYLFATHNGYIKLTHSIEKKSENGNVEIIRQLRKDGL